MSDVLPPSSLGCHWCRCPLSNCFLPRSPFTGALSRTFNNCSPSVTDLDGLRSALPFTEPVAQTFTTCGPSVHRPRRLGVVQTDASGHGVAAAAAARRQRGGAWTGLHGSKHWPANARSQRRPVHGGGRRVPQNSARGALAGAARPPQFWSIIDFNLCQ